MSVHDGSMKAHFALTLLGRSDLRRVPGSFGVVQSRLHATTVSDFHLRRPSTNRLAFACDD
jgi:hypothetical protein